MKKLAYLIALITFINNCFSQTLAIQVRDTGINNLILPSNYKTSDYGAIPQYLKKGHGDKTLILIPGWGFDATIFNDFMEANETKYIMYAITIPGFGNTMAPPLPESGTSYGLHYWNYGVLQGILKLIEREKLQKPIIVGHSTQGTQLALRMAIDYPDKVSKVIILGAHAKFIYMNQGMPQELTLEKKVAFVDKYTGPIWFKQMTRERFNEGNFLPEIYSLDSRKGLELWKESAAVPLPVMIQYICEFFASDITTEINSIKCSVLILRSTFSSEVLNKPINNYIKPQFIDSWENATGINPLIKVEDINMAATFVWKDNPVEVYSKISEFLDEKD